MVYWQPDDVFGVSYCINGHIDFCRSVSSLHGLCAHEYGAGNFQLVEITNEQQYNELLQSGVFYAQP